MADDTTSSTDTPAKPARRRSTTPAKSGAKTRTPRAKKADDATQASTTAPAAKKTKVPPKPRSTKRASTPAARKKPSTVKAATDKVGGKWGAAAVVGGIAAVGAATAALLTLRGSSARPTGSPKPTNPGAKAKQPDGTDSSRSFQAGIADENTIPTA